jgi:hypothetical protein
LVLRAARFFEVFAMQRAMLALGSFLTTLGVAAGEEFRAMIIKVDDNKVTFYRYPKNPKYRQATLPVVDNVKVIEGKSDKDKKIQPGKEVPNGLKNEIFNIRKTNKFIRALLITGNDGKNITEIWVLKPLEGENYSPD